MYQLNLSEAQKQLPILINAALQGETVFITQENNEPIVQLISVKKNQTRKKRCPQFGSAKGLITMTDDFDAPLEHFKDYMP
jgi:antitoxin (DNA-binding transcriptional repressor) of toxin-antitoxin stability system